MKEIDINALMSQWENQGVRLVVLEIADMSGMARSKIVPLSKLKQFVDQGIRMYGGTVTVDSGSQLVPETLYNEERHYGDAVLRPDLSTATILAWEPSLARVICDVHWPENNQLQPAAPRAVLRQVLTELEEAGYTAKVALEYEFYLFDQATQQDHVPHPVFLDTHIFHTLRNRHTPVLDRIMDLLPSMGIDILTGNCEYGPGQFEITYAEQDVLVAADQAYTFKQAVKSIATQLGYHASFMTKPYRDASACGGHVHISLYEKHQQTNAFLDPTDPQGLSTCAYQFLQGLVTHAPATMALLAPTPNCYRRFEHHAFAPINASVGIDDRSAMVRIKNSRDQSTHIEHRLSTSMSNPYLAIAAILAAGLQGIQEKQRLHLATVAGEEDEHAPLLPSSLEKAVQAFEQDMTFTHHLGLDFPLIFPKTKYNELQRREAFISTQQTHSSIIEDEAAFTWELEEYLSAY